MDNWASVTIKPKTYQPEWGYNMKDDFKKDAGAENTDAPQVVKQDGNIERIEERSFTDEPIPRLSDLESNRSKSPKKKLFIIVSIVLVLLIAGVMSWYFLVYSSKKDAPAGDDLSVATKFASVNTLLEKATPGLKGSVMESRSYNGISAVTDDSSIVFSAPTYKLKDKKFSVLPSEANGAGYIGDSVSSASNFSSLTTFFKDNKFKLVVESKEGEAPVSSFEKGVLVSYAVYESQDVICAIRHVDGSSTVLANHSSYIGCAERKNYEKTAGDLLPFYVSYVGDSKDDDEAIVMGGLVKEKGVEGYERAVVYLEHEALFKEGEENMNYSASGLYYKKPSSSSWSYFTAVAAHSSQLYCSEYDATAEVKKAFTGFGCFDEKTNKDSVVKS